MNKASLAWYFTVGTTSVVVAARCYRWWVIGPGRIQEEFRGQYTYSDFDGIPGTGIPGTVYLFRF